MMLRLFFGRQLEPESCRQLALDARAQAAAQLAAMRVARDELRQDKFGETSTLARSPRRTDDPMAAADSRAYPVPAQSLRQSLAGEKRLPSSFAWRCSAHGRRCACEAPTSSAS